ncbi:MAG: hypothetical protein Q9175_005282 [Cornicularia normoerica]
MTSLSTNEPMNTEEQQKLNNLITLQMDALGPARIQKLITTCYKSKAPYVPGATLRLRDLAYLTENGFLTPDEAVKVKAWRTAAAAGTVLVNRSHRAAAAPSHRRIPDRADVEKKSDTATKGPAAEDSDWEDLGVEETIEEFVLVEH